MKVTAQSEMTMQNGQRGVILKEVVIGMDLSEDIERTQFYKTHDEINRKGVELLTQAFIHALVATVKAAHTSGEWDRTEHIEYILSEFKRACTAEVTLLSFREH